MKKQHGSKIINNARLGAAALYIFARASCAPHENIGRQRREKRKMKEINQ
jgi:hypothetical protein